MKGDPSRSTCWPVPAAEAACAWSPQSTIRPLFGGSSLTWASPTRSRAPAPPRLPPAPPRPEPAGSRRGPASVVRGPVPDAASGLVRLVRLVRPELDGATLRG